jgi:hypothetical protein
LGRLIAVLHARLWPSPNPSSGHGIARAEGGRKATLGKENTAIEIKISGAHSPLLTSGLPISLSFTVAARIRGPLAPEKLPGALERLRRRHPLIAARVAPDPDGAGACFTTEGVPPIPFRVADRESDDVWVREIQCEIARPFDYRTGPFFRCVLLRGPEVSDLLIVCDHITADGRSSIYALRDLLRLCADDNLVLGPLPPPRLADLIPPPMMTKITEKIAADPGDTPNRPAWQPSAGPAEPMRVIPFELNEAETAALISRSRAEGATVQAALCAAFTLPFAERQPDAPVRFVETPMDIRSRLSRPPGEVFGNYISLVLLSLDCSPGRDPWEIAREARRALVSVTDEQLFTIPIILMNVAERPLSVPPIDVVYDLSISNLGRIDIPDQYGPLRLESIYGPTLDVSLPGHRILAVTTFGGRMRFTFTTREREAPQILRQAREWIAVMLRS